MNKVENIFAERLMHKDLTKMQRKIAEYFLENQLLVSQKSLMEVATDIGVSDVSVLRFVRLMGYDGYNAMKAELYDIIAARMNKDVSKMPLNVRYDVRAEQFPEMTPDAFMSMMHSNLESTFKQNNLDTYRKTAELLFRAKRKYIVGFRGCHASALHLARNLHFMIDEVYSITTADQDVFTQLQAIDSDDVVLILGLSRYYKMDVAICDLVQQKKTTLCVLTDHLLSPIAKNADIILLADTSSLNFAHSVIGVDCICEYLALLISKMDETSVKERLRQNDENTEFLRLS